MNLDCGIVDDLEKNSFCGGIEIAFRFVGVQLNRMRPIEGDEVDKSLGHGCMCVAGGPVGKGHWVFAFFVTCVCLLD